MKTKNNVNQPIYKLDPTSDRYRICPYCKKPHMVQHLGKDYCCDDHADKHFNEKRRLKNHAETMLEKNQKMEDKEIENAVKTISIPPQEISQDELRSQGIEKNVAIFDNIEIDPIKGSVYEIPYLVRNGVNLKHYSFKLEHNDVAKGNSCSYLIIKNYKIELVTKYKVLIIKK